MHAHDRARWQVTVHVINAPSTPQVINGVFESESGWGSRVYAIDTQTCCGKLVSKVKDGVYVERLMTIPVDSPTIRQRAKKPKVPISAIVLPGRLPKDATDRDRMVCAKCLQIARMTPDARAQTIAQNAALKKQKADAAFAKLNEKNKTKRDLERAELDALIEATRADAMACYDGWLSEPPRVLGRCGHTINANGTIKRCAFERTHEGLCGTVDFEGNPIEPAPDLDLVLDVALRALKRDTGSHTGDRLWVFRDVIKHNRPYKQRRSHRDVVCRFCNTMLGVNLPMGERGWGRDYTDFTFYTPEIGDHGISGPRAPASDSGVVNVRRHTVTCALKYLAKIPNRNDGLPEASFVLTFDDEDQPEASP